MINANQTLPEWMVETESCEDNNVCTDDECSLTEDCVFPANTLPCDDTTEEPDTCGNSSCQPGGDVCPPFEANFDFVMIKTPK